MIVRRIGIIGAGSIAAKSHLPLFLALGLEVAWVLDSVRSRSQAVARAFRVPLGLGVEDLEQAPPVDMVLLACPYGSRAPYYQYLRSRSEAIYVEKPVARSVAELADICQLRPAHAIAAGFLRRSMGVTCLMKSIVADGLFGRLRRVRSEFGTATVISAGAGFSKDLRLAGGGQLFESAIHNVDAVCHIAGVQRATLQQCRMEHEAGFDLHTEALLGMTDAQGGEFEFELLVTCLKHTRYELEFVFERATVTCSLFRPGAPVVRAGVGGRNYQLSDPMRGFGPRGSYDVNRVFLQDFFSALATGIPNYTNACTTRATAQIMELLYAAQCGGGGRGT